MPMGCIMSKIKPEPLGFPLESSAFCLSGGSSENLLVQVPSLLFFFLVSHSCIHSCIIARGKHCGFSGEQDKPDLCLHRGETDKRFFLISISSTIPKGDRLTGENFL